MLVTDNNGNKYKYEFSNGIVTLSKDDVPDGLEYIDFIEHGFDCYVGEEGYYVISDCDGHGSALCYFNKKDNAQRIYKQNLMSFFGVKKDSRCYLVIAEGYKYEFSLVYGIKNGVYYIYPRFCLYGKKPYEDISIRLIELPDNSEYSQMAVAYRNYKLANGDCKPLKDKIRERKELKYAMEAPEIRIRLAWKETPPKILEQTEENEPEMKVACNFERVIDIIDELKKQGVKKAQICLIGWNIGGHDGRYPDIFPVDERLGGEDKLKEVISHAKENGYQIVCHTNSTDCYSISKRFSEDIVIKTHDGSLSVNPINWSGGRMYHLCPAKAYEYVLEDLPKVAQMGFSGLHYIDVMSVVPLRNCFDKKHPSNSKQTLEYYEKIMQLCHNEFGGFASEGVFDFASKYLDYGLYVVFSQVDDALIDENIPLWEIVYHGIMLYNPMTDTVNYPIKGKKYELKLIEHGGRPVFYFYSHHILGADNEDWLGKEDLVCDTDEKLTYSVSKIKEATDTYEKYIRLQTEFIENYKKVKDGVYEITYSDKTVLVVDYLKENIHFK